MSDQSQPAGVHGPWDAVLALPLRWLVKVCPYASAVWLLWPLWFVWDPWVGQAWSQSGPQSGESAAALEWSYLENDRIRLGLLKSHGGAIAFLAPHGSDENRLNHFDHGRLVQQSYYGDADDSWWAKTPWRFNPVQGGDYRGNAADLIEFRADATTAYAKTVPRHWALGSLLSDCSMEQWIELHGPVVKVRYRFRYLGSMTHKARHQETPAVFVQSGLDRLLTYTGERPWTNAPLTELAPGWPNEYFKMNEHWAAYLGADGHGVGIYVPTADEATCYRYRGGGASDCSYIAPIQTFALTPNLDFSYIAYLTVGDVTEIRQRFARLGGK